MWVGAQWVGRILLQSGMGARESSNSSWRLLGARIAAQMSLWSEVVAGFGVVEGSRKVRRCSEAEMKSMTDSSQHDCCHLAPQMVLRLL